MTPLSMMNTRATARDLELREELRRFDVRRHIHDQRLSGRHVLSEATRREAAAFNARALDILGDDARSEQTRKLAEFAELITRSLAMMERSPRPTYYPYTEVSVLDWFMRSDSRPKFHAIKERATEGIWHLLRSLLRFEAESDAGMEHYQSERCDHRVVTVRTEAIQRAVRTWEQLATDLFGRAPKLYEEPVLYASCQEYVEEPSRRSALVYLTCMPQSTFHDEVCFLRTIHISELCFYGVRVSVEEATEAIRQRELESLMASRDALIGQAQRALLHACRFAELLHRTFKILYTMPKENFADFRDHTGNASAVQSRNYQMMEITFRGMPKGKREVFESNPHLKPLLKYAHPSFKHLGEYVKVLTRQPESAPVVAQARDLDKKLLTWRGLHLGFAYRYLPQETVGTGGTSGAGFWEKYLDASLFGDTALAVEVIQEVFGDLPDLFAAVVEACNRVQGPLSIAPPAEAVVATHRAKQ